MKVHELRSILAGRSDDADVEFLAPGSDDDHPVRHVVDGTDSNSGDTLTLVGTPAFRD